MRYKLITLILFIVFRLNAQTEGISYQAVIMGTTDKELPGINASNNLLVSSSVSFEFTIVDENDSTFDNWKWFTFSGTIQPDYVGWIIKKLNCRN